MYDVEIATARMPHMKHFSAFLVVLSLAMLPSMARAQQPLIDGNKTSTNLVLNVAGTFQVLLGTAITIPAGFTYHCAVTCTSTVLNPHSAASDQDYYYAASNTTNPSVTDACVRPFDFSEDTPGVDTPENLNVATTCFLPNLQGAQTFYCLGQLVAGQAVVTIESSSMYAICTDDRG